MKPKEQDETVSRRNFLKISAIWAGGATIGGYSTVRASNYVINGVTGRVSGQVAEYGVLTQEEVVIMDALADCIIPPGNYAGGSEAGVTRFIDRQLGEYLHREKAMYKTCLTALNSCSRVDYGDVFTWLDEEAQIRYLTNIEAGEYDNRSEADGSTDDWRDYTPSSFFESMRDHCMMGYYGQPKHGGNREWVSYQMLDLPVEQVPMSPGE